MRIAGVLQAYLHLISAVDNMILWPGREIAPSTHCSTSKGRRFLSTRTRTIEFGGLRPGGDPASADLQHDNVLLEVIQEREGCSREFHTVQREPGQLGGPGGDTHDRDRIEGLPMPVGKLAGGPGLGQTGIEAQSKPVLR